MYGKLQIIQKTMQMRVCWIILVFCVGFFFFLSVLLEASFFIFFFSVNVMCNYIVCTLYIECNSLQFVCNLNR